MCQEDSYPGDGVPEAGPGQFSNPLKLNTNTLRYLSEVPSLNETVRCQYLSAGEVLKEIVCHYKNIHHTQICPPPNESKGWYDAATQL